MAEGPADSARLAAKRAKLKAPREVKLKGKEGMDKKGGKGGGRGRERMGTDRPNAIHVQQMQLVELVVDQGGGGMTPAHGVRRNGGTTTTGEPATDPKAIEQVADDLWGRGRK